MNDEHISSAFDRDLETIQAQIMTLMQRLKAEFKTAIVLITHDLGVIAEMAGRVVVMYAGKVVEEAPVKALWRQSWPNDWKSFALSQRICFAK